MSISSIGYNPYSQVYSSGLPSNSNGTSKAATPGSSAAADSASSVTLSSDAVALARLNSEGITTVKIKGAGLSSGVQPTSPGAGGSGVLSEASFEAVAESFGATKAQADQDFNDVDTNGNGTVSNAELLNALSTTRNASSTTAQALLSLMDANGDHSVSGNEFLNFETADVSAEADATKSA